MDAGGSPYLVVSRRILISAWRGRLTHRRWFSRRVRAESSQTPSHLVTSLARAVWEPTRMVLSALNCQRFVLREKSMASVLVVSKLAALSIAHSRLAATHLSGNWTTSLMLSPSTIQVTSSTKVMLLLFFDLVLQRRMDLRDVDCKEDRKDRGTLGEADGDLQPITVGLLDRAGTGNLTLGPVQSETQTILKQSRTQVCWK